MQQNKYKSVCITPRTLFNLQYNNVALQLASPYWRCGDLVINAPASRLSRLDWNLERIRNLPTVNSKGASYMIMLFFAWGDKCLACICGSLVFGSNLFCPFHLCTCQ